MMSATTAAPSTTPPLLPNGFVLTCSASTTTGVSPRTGSSGMAMNTVLLVVPRWVLPASKRAVSKSATVTPWGNVISELCTPSRRPTTSCT